METVRLGAIRLIQGLNGGRYPQCHSIYVEGAKILIDPSSDRAKLEELREKDGVDAVWLSHWHEDHMMYLDLFDDVPLYICELDSPPLGDLERFLDWYQMEEPHYRDEWKDLLLRVFHIRPRVPKGFLVPGELLDLKTTSVQIIHAPGHTPGHLAFKFLDEDVLFVGDYDLTPFGPWYGDRFSSIDQTICSVRMLREIPAKAWIASHERGLFMEDPGELWERYLGVIEERERRLIELLEKPRTMKEIADACIVYGRPKKPEAFYAFGEKAIMRKHLQRLMARGMVVEEDGRYRWAS
jgi:hydroxyacylglutathione hydrolase